MSIPLSLQTLGLLLLMAAGVAPAAETKLATEEDYYRIFKLPIPDGVVLEVGSLEFFPDGKLAASSRRGDIYTISNPFATASSAIEFRRYASGLHEVLGLAWRGGWLYATQRGELSRLKDLNGNGRADVIETVNADWEITGDYHEYALGSRFDHNGDLWIALCLTGSFTSDATFRGWCLRVKPDGTMVPTCSGLRSPGGIGMNNVGDMFYTDNQGPWNGTCALKHLAPGSFQGHPAGNRWYAATDAIGPRPLDPKSNTRMLDEATRIPQLLPPAVLFPYKKMGQSASGIACDRSGGKFGPFAGQLFVADQTFSSVMRVYLEKVNGQYQGACFPFRKGFSSGNLALLASPQGWPVCRRHKPRLGFSWQSRVRPGTTGLDRKGAVRSACNASAPRRVRTHLHPTASVGNTGPDRRLRTNHVRVYLPEFLRESRSRSHPPHDCP